MMNRIKQQQSRLGMLATLFLLLSAGAFMQPINVQAQWTSPDASGNINSTNTGNVGVGTTAPAEKLSISGSLRLDGTSQGYGRLIQQVSGGNQFEWYPQATGLFLYDRTSTQYRISILNNGNVGVGTPTPIGRFEIVNTSGAYTASNYFQITGTTADNNNYPGIALKGGTLANEYPFLQLGNGGLAFTVAGGRHSASYPNRMQVVLATNSFGYGFAGFQVFNGTITKDLLTVKDTGNVGVGTTGPQALLDLQKAFSDTGGSGFSLGFSQAGGIYHGWRLNTSGVLILDSYYTNVTNTWNPSIAITKSSSVGIGTATPDPSYKLDVAGKVRSSTGGFVFPDGSVQTTAATTGSGGGGGGGTITGVTAGTGLTGGGTTGAVTLNVGAGTGLTASDDAVSVNYGSTAGTAVQGNTSINIAAGTGMSGGGTLTLGNGGTVTVNNADPGSSQPIFKNIANAAGTTQFAAGSNNDALRFEGTGGTSVSFDAAAKKVVINSTSTSSTLSAANVSAGQFGQNTGGGNYSFPGDVTVNGNIAAKYQDVAEWVTSRQKLSAGTVVILDPEKSNQVIASTESYDTRVAGVISEQPGLLLGEGGEGKVKVATTGRVRVKVDASRGPIKIGDLLVTSGEEGVAMKSEPINFQGRMIHSPGTIIGKALEPLANGKGEILVLLSLQ